MRVKCVCIGERALLARALREQESETCPEQQQYLPAQLLSRRESVLRARPALSTRSPSAGERDLPCAVVPAHAAPQVSVFVPLSE